MSLPEQITDHAERALARVLQQWKSKTKVAGEIELYADQTQDLEDALWQLATLRYLATAEGVQLDALGKLLVEPRGYMDDDEYRLALAGVALLLRSSGTVENIYAVLGAMLPGVTYTLEDRFPAGFLFTIEKQLTTNQLAVLSRFLRRARMAGVRGQLLYFLSPLASVFTFSDDGTKKTDSSKGFSDVAQTTGGYWAGVTE